MAKARKVVQESFMEELIRPGIETEAGVLSVGATLKAARLKRPALTLEKIAGEICAWPYHVKAIEDDKFDLLPGTTYAVGFIRAYANYVGLDAGALVSRFKDEMAGEPLEPGFVCLESVNGPHLPKWIMAATILIIFSGTYITWLGLNKEYEAPARVAAAPVSVAETETRIEIVTDNGQHEVNPDLVSRVSTKDEAGKIAIPKAEAHKPQQVNPIPVSQPAKLVPHGQKSVDAAGTSQVRHVSYAWADHHDPLTKSASAGGAFGQFSAGHYMTTGKRGTLDLVVGGMNTSSEQSVDALRKQVSFDPEAFFYRSEPLAQ